MKKIGNFWCMLMDNLYSTELLVGEEHQQGRGDEARAWFAGHMDSRRGKKEKDNKSKGPDIDKHEKQAQQAKRCDDCPDFWNNYVEGWKSLFWNFNRMFGINLPKLPRVGIYIDGDGSGMEQYAQKYMDAMGLEGQLDLSKEENIFKLLNYLTLGNELDAVDRILLTYNSNPLNQSYKGVPLWWESEYSGYYVSFWGGPNHPYVYERVKVGSGYRMRAHLKSSLEESN